MPVLWERTDGKVSLMTFVDEVVERERQPGESTESVVMRLAFIDREKVPHLAGAVPYLVKKAEVPTDRSNRDVWTVKNGKIDASAPAPDKRSETQKKLDELTEKIARLEKK